MGGLPSKIVDVNYNIINGFNFLDYLHYSSFISDNPKPLYVNCNFKRFDMCTIKSAVFIDCKFNNVVISGDIYASIFNNCDFINVEFDHSNTNGCNFNNCSFNGIEMNNCKLHSLSINDCAFSDMIIQNCYFDETVFIKSSDFWFHYYNKSAILNSKIYSRIQNCIFVDSGIYLYKCDFSYNSIDDIRLLYYKVNVMTYESNLNDAIRSNCPKEGSFICYKKVYTGCGRPVIATLEVPADAKRISSFGRKCRAEYAKVIKLELQTNHDEDITVAYSDYNEEFVYRKGEIVYSDSFDDNMFNECSNGINFFMDKADAVAWNTRLMRMSGKCVNRISNNQIYPLNYLI